MRNWSVPPPPVARALRLPLRLDRMAREAVIAHARAAWALTDWLFEGLRDPATLAARPDPLRNPLIFYVGHSAAFWLNTLRAAGLLDDDPEPALCALFARGVDPAAASELDGAQAWPGADEAAAFRRRALDRVVDALERCPLSPCDWDAPAWAVQMALEHERIHFETSSVLLRQLPLDAVSPPPGWQLAESAGPAPAAEPIAFAGGAVDLGRPPGAPTYGWDNEYGHDRRAVAPFRAARHLVSNGAFAAFVERGGYHEARWWCPEGWAWVRSAGVDAPRFWRRGPGGWRLRTVFREVPLPPGWPVEVNHYEAMAWCRFVGARLPTEAEQRFMMADAARVDGDVVFEAGHHLALAACSPRDVYAGAPTPRGLHDPVGNVWQWLGDDFHPLPGFRAHPLYADFSAPYFDPDHKMMLGGSWASTGTSASEWYRLWFRPHFYQHAGFRPVWSP